MAWFKFTEKGLMNGLWSRPQTGKVTGRMSTCRRYIALHWPGRLTSELPTQWKRNMKRPCRELRRTNINSNTTRCLFTASNPNNQLIPSRGVRMTTPFTPALESENNSNDDQSFVYIKSGCRWQRWESSPINGTYQNHHWLTSNTNVNVTHIPIKNK